MVKINPNKINEFIANPNSVAIDDLALLNKVCEIHPYFQAPKAVRLKSLKEQESYLYNLRLKETAAFTQDRSILFEFITSSDFLTNENEIKTIEAEDFLSREEVDLIVDPEIFVEKKAIKEEEETIEEIEIKNLDDNDNLTNDIEESTNCCCDDVKL